MDSIAKEMQFYDLLVTSQTAYMIDEEKKDVIKWNPIAVTGTEMWYMLDLENGLINVTLNTKTKLDLLNLEEEYWNAMRTMSYPYNPKLGWKNNRYDKLCGARLDNGEWKCDMRPICGNFNTFQDYVNKYLGVTVND
jgi:hypothetical protein